jgi:heat shock protein HslJ
MNRFVFAVMAAASVGAGCGSAVMTGPSSVTGAAWKLQSIQTSTGTIAISRPDNFTVTFGDDSKLGIKADCNVCGGNYSLSGGGLSISQTFCTLAYCGDTSNDRQFMDVLNNATSIGVAGSELTIGSTKGIARFTR